MNINNDSGTPTVDDLISALGGPANALDDDMQDDVTDSDADDFDDSVADEEDYSDSDDDDDDDDDDEYDDDDESDDDDDDDDDDDQNSQRSQQERQAAAFAQMRIQNRQMQQTLQGIAQLVGIDPTNLEQVHSAVQQKLLEAQAKKQNVPPELLGRLQMLEKQNNEREAYLGFQKVKDSFNLSEEALQQFADDLAANGINPFETKVDLVNEYVVRNYQSLLESAHQRGVQEEAERAAKAAKKSTQPGTKSGKDKEIPDKINTISDLDKFLDEA